MNEWLADDVPAGRENVARENIAARSGQETLLVMIEDSVAPASEIAAGATAAGVPSLQGTSVAGTQRSTSGEGTCQDVEVNGREVGPDVGGPKPAIVANAVAVAALEQVGSDMVAKVEEMMEKLKVENLSLHGELVAEKRAHARALMDNFCFQRD